MSLSNIPIDDLNLSVLLSERTGALTLALDEHSRALEGLVNELRKYNDWLEEELVRMEGER